MFFVGFSSYGSFVDYYVDVIFSLNKNYFDKLCQWLTSLVNTDGFPSNNVNKEQKQQFATLILNIDCNQQAVILKERGIKRKLQEIVQEFSIACSGLAGVSQAVQMNQVQSAWDRISDRAEQKSENQTDQNSGASAPQTITLD